MLNSVTCNLSTVQCNEKDMSTLLHFKQGVIDIDPSGLLSSWFTQQDCCQWKGVQCDNITGRVTELNLPCHTDHFAVVAYYEEKDDKSHCLTESLGQLVNLESLEVYRNNLTGNVSERNFHHLLNLKELYLGSTAGLIFDFDPEWVPPFHLQHIRLRHVHYKLPSWIFTQSSLKFLIISDSSASFEPLDKLWNFSTQLEYFHLENNIINGDMSNVLLNSKVVCLDNNKLTGSLPQLSPKVIFFSANSNYLSGPIAPLLCHNMINRSSFMYLDLGNNLLSGELTDCWNDWKSLIHVNLGNNGLVGKIPHSMSSLSNLVLLSMYDNKFFGDVPLSLKNCQKLRFLDLSRNNFSGAIPSWMMGQNVKALQLRSNQVSGNIPPQICQLHSLKVLDFANNRLSGPIPNCLHNMTRMTTILSDSNNDVSYTISAASTSITLFITFTMLIKGHETRIPSLICDIDLSNNSLSGEVPREIYMLTGLQSLNLSHNQLVGTISEEIGNLKQLESIDLSSNRLSGEIPQAMSGLYFLGTLNLSYNNFEGKIPSGTQLQSFTNLSFMGNPQICGPPLTKICQQDEKPTGEKEDDDESEFYSWFYMGLGIGFAVGFLGVLGVIFFNRTFRHAYFRFLHRMLDR
ncbi:Leucine-rich repeat [Sesbania bispinosa]|nr:Leucine-rich repeat [Sesbania bispinosa]